MSRDSDVRKTAAMVVTDKAAPTVHEHPIAEVTGLQAALDGKAPSHDHPYEPAGAIQTHEAANDPHPMYLRQSEADALYDTLGAASAAQSAAASALASHAAASDPHTGYQKESEKGQPNGFASLDGNGKVPTEQLPAGQSGGAAWGEVTGTLSDQTDLQTALDEKSGTDHDHDADYAPLSHAQAISTVTGLQAALDGKQAAGSYEPANANIQAHVASTSNPHSVTKAQVGLGNVDNTSDAAKPVSTATQTALNAKQNSLGFTPENAANKAQANGYASLGADGKVPADQLPAASGSDPWTIVALSSDFTTTSSTAQNVTGLEFTPAANGRYMFEAVLGIRTATATVNPRVGLAWPTGLTDGVAQIDESQSATARLMSNGNINASLLVAVGGIPNTTQSWPVTVWGWVKAGATPSGNVRIQLASETNGTTVRVTAHSYLRYRTYP